MIVLCRWCGACRVVKVTQGACNGLGREEGGGGKLGGRCCRVGVGVGVVVVLLCVCGVINIASWITLALIMALVIVEKQCIDVLLAGRGRIGVGTKAIG